MSKIPTDEQVQAKAKKMQEKTELARSLFGLPDTEVVIQDYRCELKGQGLLKTGQLYVTQNYLCFSGLRQTMEVIPFSSIQSLSNNVGWVSSRIEITAVEGQYFFGSFYHHNEAFFLIQHLWEHTPTYIYDDDSKTLAESLKKKAGDEKYGDFSDDEGLDNLDDYENGYLGQRDQYNPKPEYEKVDVNTSKQAIAKAKELRNIGAETLAELEEQAEILDRIEHSVKEINMSLDHGDRIIDGVETWVGGVKNLVTPDRYAKGAGVFNHVDRTIDLGDDDNYYDVPILIKHSNDDFQPAFMRFGTAKFLCATRKEKKPIKGFMYDYEKVNTVVMRARHQHLDVRFKDRTPRFRCMTSYIQAFTNELALRCHALNVLFEPGTKSFGYGSLAIRGDCIRGDRKESSTAFTTKRKSLNNLMGEQMDSKTRADVQEVEEDLDEIDQLVGDLKSISSGISSELDRQNATLDKTHKRTDRANNKSHKNTYRVTRMV